jgi:hypothetical protein
VNKDTVKKLGGAIEGIPINAFYNDGKTVEIEVEYH